MKQLKDKIENVYNPSDKEKEVVARIFNLFTSAQNARNQPFKYFDGNTLVEYIDQSVNQFVTNIYERDDIEDWQARVHDPLIRNKCLAILGKVVNTLPIIEIMSRGDEDSRRSFIVDNLYRYSEDIDDYDELIVFAVLEALVKGTCVCFEGQRDEKKKNRDTGKDIKINKLYGEIVPLENFYPSSVGIRKIKDMPFCFIRNVMNESEFKMKWGHLESSKYVVAKKIYSSNEVRPFYADYISAETSEGQIEELRYYNQVEDEYVIIANGVWLNPKDNDVAPIPFKHKRLPFWAFRYDIFGIDFFYGKSMPDKLKSLSVILDVLHNMLLDQSFLSIFSQFIFAGIDPIEEDFLKPGGKITLDTGGLPIDHVVKNVTPSTPAGWHQYILEFTKKILEESSMDTVQQGMAGAGERVTATEIRQAAGGVITLLGVFAKFINFGLKDKAYLRTSNILQFWTKKPFMEGMMGEGGVKEFNDAFNFFVIENTVLTSGKRGTLIIDLYKEKNKMPIQQDLKIRQQIAEKVTGKNIEIIAVDGNYLARDMNFDFKFVPNIKSEYNRDLDRVFEINFQTVMNKLYPDMIQREELCAELIEKFGKNPSKIMKKEIISPLPTPTEISETPEMGTMKSLPQNILKGQTGEGDSSLAIRDLMPSV